MIARSIISDLHMDSLFVVEISLNFVHAKRLIFRFLSLSLIAISIFVGETKAQSQLLIV